MKTWMFGALALAMTLATGVASACPTGNVDPVPQRPRPVNNVSFQATQLFERAQQLETAAASHERSAAAFERDAETLAKLPAALEALPTDQREAIVLVDLEGQKGCDAAAALGVPEGTLWRRLFHARKALRAALGGEP